MESEEFKVAVEIEGALGQGLRGKGYKVEERLKLGWGK